MLDKLSGVFAPRPSPGPHKLRECLPLIIILRNRLRYALNSREVTQILGQKLIKVDGKVRTDPTYPAGFMDVLSIEKTNEIFRLLYDVKGRFVLQKITEEESKFKLCKVRRLQVGAKGIPYVALHDGRTVRFPDPLIKVNDTVKLDIATGKILDFAKFEVGNLVMVVGGRNLGRIGVISSKEKHPGSFDIVHIRDAIGQQFATRVSNVFVIGKGTKSLVTLPSRKGIKRPVWVEAEVKANSAAEAQQKKSAQQ
jgi:small subunit ribosomal protein S4e